VDAVVQEEDLPAAILLAQECVTHEGIVRVVDQGGLDLLTARRSNAQRGDVAHARKRHVQRARDRSG
jgi:hypothetical protein